MGNVMCKGDCKGNDKQSARGHTEELGKGPRSQSDIQVRVNLLIQALIYTTKDGLCTVM